EFTRVLRPGGLLIMTVQPRRFLQWTASLRERPASQLSSWERSLSSAFGDVATMQEAYDRGAFIFSATGGGEHRPAAFYGEALIPESYLRRTEGARLELMQYIDDAAVCAQAIAVFRRKSA